MTLAKQPPGSEGGDGGEGGARPLTSFQAPVRTQEQQEASGGANGASSAETVPPIPEPDYSSDEEGAADGDKKKSKEQNGDLHQASSGGKPGSSDHPAVKHLTSTATVVFRSSSPVAGVDGQQTANAEQQQTNGKTFTTKNMFEELREQSAKITNSARARFATDGRQNSTTGAEDQASEQGGKGTSILKRGNSQEGGEVSNVMKNVAEFEKMRLGAKEMAAARMAAAAAATNGTTTSTNGVASNGTTASAAADLSNMRMSKSCIEELHAANSLKRGGKFGN